MIIGGMIPGREQPDKNHADAHYKDWILSDHTWSI